MVKRPRRGGVLAYQRAVRAGVPENFNKARLVADRGRCCRLTIALCVEVYLIGRVTVQREWICISSSVLLLLTLAGLWYVFPFTMRLRHEGEAPADDSTIRRRGK
jgi:hypothetical protein